MRLPCPRARVDALLYSKRVIDTGDNMARKAKLAKALEGSHGKKWSPSQAAKRNRSLRLAF